MQSRHEYGDRVLRIRACYHFLVTREAHVRSSVDHIRSSVTAALSDTSRLGSDMLGTLAAPQGPLSPAPSPPHLPVGFLAPGGGGGGGRLTGEDMLLTCSVPTYLAIYRNRQG